jgi:very-short-patch-repair endonuclease
MPHATISDRQKLRAKSLRQSMTHAETLLWRYLKAHHLDGLSFRRQVPMGAYVADFVCHGAHLVIEIDGASHDFDARQQHDQARDKWFASQGYIVLRFSNADVTSNLEGVLGAIRNAAVASLRGVPPSLTLPHKGGGNEAEPIEWGEPR